MNDKSLPSMKDLETEWPGVFVNNEVTMNYLIAKNVLVVPTQCKFCGADMSVKRGHNFLYQCTRRNCRRAVSIMHGTFFEGCKDISSVLYVCHLILSGSQNEVLKGTGGLSAKTCAKWRKHLQEIMMVDLENLPEENMKLGGPNWDGPNAEHSIVEIDECKLGKRKYHVGHRVEGVWVVGLVERSRPGYVGRFVVVSVPDRKGPTLGNIIEKYVNEGACLHSDMWKGYQSEYMEYLGIVHRTVNHSKHFKDPDTGVHTNTIEDMWQAVRYRVPRQSRTTARVDNFLWQFMWKRRYKDKLWNRLLLCFRLTHYGPLHGDAEQVLIQPVQQEVGQQVEQEEYMWGEPLCLIS